MSPPAVADGLEIVECRPDHPDAIRLLEEFYRDQLGRYGFADPAGLDAGEFVSPGGVFVVAYHRGVAVGCGGWRWFDRSTGTVEIKKTYVVPDARGLGTGRVLLTWLEARADKAGGRRAILETGVRNIAALGLFASAGYQPVPSYVDGRDPLINRAFARLLTSPTRN